MAQRTTFGSFPETQWDTFDVILADSFALATELNTAKAAVSPGGAFGVVATTFRSWIEGLWEQHGDGRRFASQPASVLLLRILINEGRVAPELADTPNLPIAAEKCSARGAGTAAYEAALADPSAAPGSLSAGERALLGLLGAFRERLGQLGFVERGEAAAVLAGRSPDVFGSALRVCYVSDAPLPLLVHEFFERAAPSVELVHLDSSGAAFTGDVAAVALLPEGRSVSFALPAGRFADPLVLARVVEATQASGPVVVAARDPYATYTALLPALDALGLYGAMRARVPLGQTHMGRVYDALHAALAEEGGQAVALACSDVLHAPLFGLRDEAIQRLQASIRADRLVNTAQAIDALSAESETFRQFVSLLASPTDDALSALHEAVGSCPGYTPLERREDADVLDMIGAFLIGAVDLGVAPEDAENTVHPLLSGTVVALSRANWQVGLSQEPDVLVVSLRQAATLSPSQCSTMVIWDLNGKCYPATRRDDAVSTFLAHLGVEEPDDFQNAQRRTFGACVGLPTRHLVLGRCLHDADMRDEYPAAMLEEFLEVNGIDVPAAVPDGQDAVPALFLGSEDDFVADALGRSAPWGTQDAPAADFPQDDPLRELFAQVYAPRPDHDGAEGAQGAQDAQGAAEHAGATTPASASASGQGVEAQDVARLVESPSNLEVYHECPRKWFVERWLNLGTPGEGFGPLERGVFIHECVRTFYTRWLADGQGKVNTDRIEEARGLMRDVVGQVRVAQYSLSPGAWETRYVATPGNPAEEGSYLQIERMLSGAWLDAEAAFLAGTTFVPTLFEYVLEQPGAVIGGVQVQGRVDRIDIDEGGHLIVVDYKGGIGDEYNVEVVAPAASTDAEEPDPDADDPGAGEPAPDADDPDAGEPDPKIVVQLAGRKLQTLLYASALREKGLVVPDDATDQQRARIARFNDLVAADDPARVAGAVYFSYNERTGSGRLRSAGFCCAAGPATPGDMLLDEELPVLVPEGSEGAFFEGVEQAVAAVCDGQAAGRIDARELLPLAGGQPSALDEGICHYCPDRYCEGRVG